MRSADSPEEIIAATHVSDYGYRARLSRALALILAEMHKRRGWNRLVAAVSPKYGKQSELIAKQKGNFRYRAQNVFLHRYDCLPTSCFLSTNATWRPRRARNEYIYIHPCNKFWMRGHVSIKRNTISGKNHSDR